MNVNDENHYDSIKIKRSKASEVLRTARSHGFQKGDVWIEGDTCYYLRGSEGEAFKEDLHHGDLTRDEKTWDNAIQAADASRIIEQKNGYTLGINSQGTICLAFPGETIDNPHMYLGKENEKNLADAKIMFMEFAR